MNPWIKALALAPAMLAGCATSSYCTGEQKYQKAQSVPALRGVEGVTLPDSATALKIPPPPERAVAYGEVYTDEDGDEAVRCLDKPPAMPPVTPPAAAPAPAPAPAAPAATPPPESAAPPAQPETPR